MHLFLKRDINLQYIVYKLVPDLFKNEMKRRKTFYSKHPKAMKYLKKRRLYDKEAIGELDENIFLFENYTDISLSIEYSETGMAEICDSLRSKELEPCSPKSYLLCPATFTVSLLKKFLSLKHRSPLLNRLDIMYDDKPLSNDWTLLDIAYIYAWRRTAPMRLFYRIKSIEDTPKQPSQQAVVANETTGVLANLENKPDKKIESVKAKESLSFSEKENTEPETSLDTSHEISIPKQPEKPEDLSISTLHNNPNQMLNENLTIAAMVANIGRKQEENQSLMSEVNKSTNETLHSDKENTELAQQSLICAEAIKVENNVLKDSNQQAIAETNDLTPLIDAKLNTEETRTKTKAKKTPAAPAGGVSKKKKIALTPNNDSNDHSQNNANKINIPKKPKAPRASKASAKSELSLAMPQDGQDAPLSIKQENKYFPQMPNNQQQPPTFQQQIQQHFSIQPFNQPAQFSNKSISQQTASKANHMPPVVPPANFQMMPMNLMNHFMSKQQQDMYQWNQLSNNSQLMANAFSSIGQKFNPSLFEYFQSKAHTFQQQQQQQFFNPSQHAQLQQQQSAQFYNQYEDFKKPFNNGSNFQELMGSQHNFVPHQHQAAADIEL